MLDTHQFVENLNDIQNKLYNSFFLREVERANLSPMEKAQMDMEILKLASQSALQLQQTMQKERELEFNLYKARAELEVNIIQAKAQATKALSEAIISVIQAYVTKVSVTDNANIQRANIYTNLLNTIANASNLNAISQKDKNGNSHISNTIDIISKIKDTEDPHLDKSLNKCIVDLVERSKEIMLLGAGCQDVFIICAKKELEVNENLEIHGLHIFSNNESEFILNEKVIKGKNMIFSSDKEGIFKITFRAKNINDKWIETSVDIVVKKNIIDRELPLIESEIK